MNELQTLLNGVCTRSGRSDLLLRSMQGRSKETTQEKRGQQPSPYLGSEKRGHGRQRLSYGPQRRLYGGLAYDI